MEELDGGDMVSTTAKLRESLDRSQAAAEPLLNSLTSKRSQFEQTFKDLLEAKVRHDIIQSNIDKTLKAAQGILAKFEVARQVEDQILRGPSGDLNGYILAIDQLKEIIDFHSSNRIRAQHDRELLLKAMGELEGELRIILTECSILPDDDQLIKAIQNKNPVLPILVSPSAVPRLRDIAERMRASGYQTQCLNAYTEFRASSLIATLSKLGVQHLSKDDVDKMKWTRQEEAFGQWSRQMRIAVKLLYAAELKLCDDIFDDVPVHKCFTSVTESSFRILLNSGQAFANMKKVTPEKLFVFLESYEVMNDLLPEIASLFAGDTLAEVANVLTQKLGQLAQQIFFNFLDAVEKDVAGSSVLDGNVHRLTSYVMNYVKFLFDCGYESTLQKLVLRQSGEHTGKSFFEVTTPKLMTLLLSNLETKAREIERAARYGEALKYIFLMNNVHYIVKVVRSVPEIRTVLGNDWVQRHRRIVQQHAKAYQRAAWSKMLNYFSSKGLAGGSGDLPGLGRSITSRNQLKERFLKFNSHFDELYQAHSAWTIPDTELCDAVKLSIAEVMLSAYRDFVQRYRPILENGRTQGKNIHKYVKYSSEELEEMVDGLFDAKPSSANNSRELRSTQQL